MVAVLDNFRLVPVEVSDRLAPVGDHILGGQNAFPVRRRQRNSSAERDRHQMQLPRPTHEHRRTVPEVRLRPGRVPGDHHHRGRRAESSRLRLYTSCYTADYIVSILPRIV